jgi:molybdopterin-guanine dinucleotide biosynthesis protein B
MKDPLIIGFYGKSDSGKTTLITDIIKKLKTEFHNVATVKITDKKIGIDKKGKDTWKHAKSGANLVVFKTEVETDFILKQTKTEKEIIEQIKKIGDYDIIILEGSKHKEIPKIRIGNIEERENTIFNYSNDFQKLIDFIKKQMEE